MQQSSFFSPLSGGMSVGMSATCLHPCVPPTILLAEKYRTQPWCLQSCSSLFLLKSCFPWVRVFMARVIYFTSFDNRLGSTCQAKPEQRRRFRQFVQIARNFAEVDVTKVGLLGFVFSLRRHDNYRFVWCCPQQS